MIRRRSRRRTRRKRKMTLLHLTPRRATLIRTATNHPKTVMTPKARKTPRPGKRDKRRSRRRRGCPKLQSQLGRSVACKSLLEQVQFLRPNLSHNSSKPYLHKV